MRKILDEAVNQFDWVILDAPPLGPVADANLLAEMVDAAQGDIQLSSEPGLGTTATVRLPSSKALDSPAAGEFVSTATLPSA